MRMTLFAISLLFAATSFAGILERGSVPVKLDMEYVILEAEVACLYRYHPQDEGETGPALFFYNVSEYNQYKNLVKKGYRHFNALQGGQVCSSRNGNMKTAGAGLFDNVEKMRKAAKDQNAIVKGNVVLLKTDESKNQLDSAIDNLLEQLLK